MDLQPETCCVMINHLPLHITDSMVKTELEKQGFKVQFANVKFSVRQNNLSPNCTIGCYVEIVHLSESSLEKLHHLFMFNSSTPVTILSTNQPFLPSAIMSPYEWNADIVKHILSYFHSPPRQVFTEHRQNSYNELALRLVSKKRYCFRALEDHWYFSQYLAEKAILSGDILYHNIPKDLKFYYDFGMIAMRNNAMSVPSVDEDSKVWSASSPLSNHPKVSHTLSNEKLLNEKNIVVDTSKNNRTPTLVDDFAELPPEQQYWQ